VCKEWHRFSSFEKWGKEQYKEIGWELDKDWLLMGNRVYSPETCCFAPMEINRMISKHRHFKPEAPLGVHYHKRDKKYYVSVGYKRKFLGSFNSADEAHEVYKLEKKNKIVEMANKWKGKISDKLYNAMLNYKVN
jgi:hypothetical protein